MKINRLEILGYSIIVIGVYLLILIDILIFATPQLTEPERSDNQDITDNDTIETSISNGDVNGDGIFGGYGGFVRGIQYLLIVLILLFSIYFLYQLYQWHLEGKLWFHDKQKEEKEQIQRIKDARAEAYNIIEQGLTNETYTVSFINAYLALDEALDYFREIKRPKHWTPKEYAYKVSSPVFRPSVYRFVDTFYTLRYGSEKANRQDLLDFKQELDYLFDEDVPDDIRERWQIQFESARSSSSEISIRRDFDLTKPQGGKE